MSGTSNIARLGDTRIHDWYRHVYAYSDLIIADLAEEWDITSDDLLLDPFNGTGTTTVAGKKLGIDTIGTDVNPVGVVAGRAKTDWEVNPDAFNIRRRELMNQIQPALKAVGEQGRTTLSSFNDETHDVDLSKYDFTRSPKLPEGWMSERPFKKMQVVRHHVEKQPEDGIGRLFRLAMIAVLPEEVANVGFGPEAYRTEPQEDVDVYRVFRRKLEKMERDLRHIQEAISAGEVNPGRTEVHRADARTVSDVLERNSALYDEHGGIDYIITSPPYPAEHDYTRNQRLELVWLGAVEDNEDLREVKSRNIRSHTKNIYASDDEGDEVDIRANDDIDAIVSELEAEVERRGDISGFEECYPRVIEEYFGGMQLHLEDMYDMMAPGGKAGYVVADQQSYWQVEVKTGEILAQLAENRVGFEIEELKLWRNLHPTTGAADELREEIVVLSKLPD